MVLSGSYQTTKAKRLLIHWGQLTSKKMHPNALSRDFTVNQSAAPTSQLADRPTLSSREPCH